jgi:hypothetical protein
LSAARVSVRTLRKSLGKITPADWCFLLRRFLLAPQPNYMALLHAMPPCDCILGARDTALLAAVARGRRAGAIKMLLDRGVILPLTVTLLACVMAREGDAGALAGLLDLLDHESHASWRNVCMAAVGAWTEIDISFRHLMREVVLTDYPPRPEVAQCVAERMRSKIDAFGSETWGHLVRMLAVCNASAPHGHAADLVARLAAGPGSPTCALLREALVDPSQQGARGKIMRGAYMVAVLISLRPRSAELFAPDMWIFHENPAVTAGYCLWHVASDDPLAPREEREARAESFFSLKSAGLYFVYAWCSRNLMRGSPALDLDDEWQRIKHEQYDREQDERDAAERDAAWNAERK